MKKNILVMLSILTLAVVPLLTYAAEVKNVKVSKEGDKTIATYDLVGASGEQEAEVTVAVIVNGERKTSDKLSITGDFGKGVKVGTGKKIIWNATKDLPANVVGNLSFDIEVVNALDKILAAVKQREESKQREERIKSDLGKYQEVARSKYGQEMKAAAWAALLDLYPEAKGVTEGDEEGFMRTMGLTQDKGETVSVKDKNSIMAKEEEQLKRRTEEQQKAKEDEQRRRGTEEQQQRAEQLKAEGVIDDPVAGLQWAVAPDKAMTWDQANEYVQNLSIAGGGWRLPTKGELRSLYKRLSSFGGREVFINSGWFVWSSEFEKDSEGKPSRVWGIGFAFGNGFKCSRDNSNVNNRALAVRSRS